MSHDEVLRDLTDGINELRHENSANHREMAQRFDRLEGRVTVLETEGVSSVGLQQLKLIEQRFNQHLQIEEKRHEESDRRQDALSLQLTAISNSTTQVANVLNQIQADMAAKGRDAGARAATAVTLGGGTVAAIAYGVLQYFFG